MNIRHLSVFAGIGALLLIAAAISFSNGQRGQPRPLTMEAMRSREYPGGEIIIEQELGSEGGFHGYVVSYPSDGLKLYALMNVPDDPPPFPVIIVNHGHIPPAQYSTRDSYKEYSDFFARNGYLVFKPDYRGHGESADGAEEEYFPPPYVFDVLNLISSVKRYSAADGEHIGMWGHSLGGSVTLRASLVSEDMKALVIAAGGVGSAQDMVARMTYEGRKDILELFGGPGENPELWNAMSPIRYVGAVTAPLQLHHGTEDERVPKVFSDRLEQELLESGKAVEYVVYEGGDHEFSGENRSVLLRRSLEFFDAHLKGGSSL